MKFLFLLLSVLASLTVAAESGNNAVIALQCADKVISYDRWYGENINKLSFVNFKLKSSLDNKESFKSDYSRRILLRVKKFIDFGDGLSFIAVMHWMPVFLSYDSGKINYIESFQTKDPELSSLQFVPKDCVPKTVILAKPNLAPKDDNDHFKILVNNSLWSKMSELDKTLSLGHVVFSGATWYDENVPSSHYQTKRYLNAILFSDQILSMHGEKWSNIYRENDGFEFN